jgi:HD-GYP domain-containing protein (c-di-GMP phosphodiesterase class II)
LKKASPPENQYRYFTLFPELILTQGKGGIGYPKNLKGDEILMEARILAVADVVEAMASHRPYRPALGIEEALEEIEKNKGILYDEVAADACMILFREKGYQFT